MKNNEQVTNDRNEEIKGHNVMINRQNIFDQPVKNNLRTYDSTRKNARFSARL